MVALSPQVLAFRASTSPIAQWILAALLAAPAVAIVAHQPSNSFVTNALKVYRFLNRAASILPGTYGGIQLDAEQAENASIILEVGRELGATDKDLEIAIMTAYQESQLRNLDHGDRDSLGLFQQRPSQDWGTPEQLTDPRYAARAFFTGSGTNPGLLSIDNRESLDPLEVSHQVQRSAFPEAPGQWAKLASEVVANAGEPTAAPQTDLERAIASIGKPESVSWASDTAPLKSGDMIGTFRVSRGTIPGEHDGVDVATPEGTPLFVFGEKGESITVTCSEQMEGNTLAGWGRYGTFHVPSTGKSFLVAHLSECNPGTYQPGEVWGYSGNTGKSTGPHTHVEQFTGTKTGYAALPEEPMRAYVGAIHGVF